MQLLAFVTRSARGSKRKQTIIVHAVRYSYVVGSYSLLRGDGSISDSRITTAPSSSHS